VSATGFIPGTNFSTTITGKIGVDRSAPPHSALTASLSIPYAGEWSFRVTQNEVNFLGSPKLVQVIAGPTDPASCTASLPSVIKAGETFIASIAPRDRLQNPTAHPADSFKVYLDDPSDATTLPGLTFSDAMTSAGSKKLNIIHDVDGVETEIAGSPFGFQVLAAAADAASSTHNVDFASFESRKAAATLLELRVDPFDQFNNTLTTATGYAVAINGGDPILLLPPSFSYTHTIPQGFSGSLLLSFTLDGTPIANSPVTIDVAPDWTIMYVGVGSSILLLLGLAAFAQYRRISMSKVMRIQSNLLGIERSQSRMKQENAQLEAEQEELEEEVRLKKHSEEELKVMVAALEAVSKERQDELKEVMMDSKELRIDKMLGKGG